MWKYYFLFSLLLTANCFSAKAQKEKAEFFAGVALQPALEAGTRIGVYFELKGQYNFKDKDAVTLSAGISPMIGTNTNFIIPYVSNFTIVPFLFGYQKRFDKLYIEPQLGVGIFSKTITYDAVGHEKVFNDAAFFWGANGGYRIKRFLFFLKYHRLNSLGSSSLDKLNKTFGFGGLGVLIKLD